MTAKDKIDRAKVQLILTQPFYATIMMHNKFIESTEVKTGCTNGKYIKYNPQWIESLSVEQTKGFIAHEVSHIALLHHTRIGARDLGKWGRACDYAINTILTNAGFELPTGGCIDKVGLYKDMSAEEIYSKLPDSQPDNDNKPNEDPGGDGGVEKAPANSQAQLQQIESETKQIIAQATEIAKQKGKLPAHMDRLVQAAMETKVNWKDVLNSFISEVTRNDYTFKRPNKRHISRGFYLPSLESIERGKFVLMVDTSASIDNELLNEFAGEMQSILSDVAQSITVMYIDTKLYKNNIQEFEIDDEMKLTPKGGGGTDFKPGFDYMEKNTIDCAAVIYFTDGFCNSYPQEPQFPVLWAVYDNKDFKPPFGETVKID